MKIFLTGANGFIGGAVAAQLIRDGCKVRGLVRDATKAEEVKARGIEPVIGSLDDSALLEDEAGASEGVVSAASSDHRGAVEAIVAGLAGSGKPLLHTNGSSVVADEAMGEPSEKIYFEDTPIEPMPEKTARVAIDQLVLHAPGICSVVLCCSMIYGTYPGNPAQSVQIPVLANEAKKSGVARYIGRGLNRWSNVHIEDVAELYAAALRKATAGTFLYVENGEEVLGNVVRAIGARIGTSADSWNAEEAIRAWGREMAMFALGSNSRVRGNIARDSFGWNPKHRSVTEWIQKEMS
jgi:nucleoside-diphosphate-sugar epimerase